MTPKFVLFIVYLSTVRATVVVPCQTFQTATSDVVQEQAVQSLLQRLIPLRAKEFVVKVNRSLLTEECKDKFEIRPLGSRIEIAGSTGVAAANGLRYYLKRFCNFHISWTGDQLKLPVRLPQPLATLQVVLHDRLRYYQNVCTQSYSMVWWQWDRWEREIDYMALLGINAALAFTGQEYQWKRVFLSFNLTERDIEDYFTGPAFLAWNRMGNLYKWGGPLGDSWMRRQYDLLKTIVDRMRQFGMLTIFPAFAGHVPNGFSRVFPQAKVSHLSPWSKFDCNYSCTLFLEPEDQLFEQIGKKFVDLYMTDFGTDHLYNTDLFNEMTPKTKDTKYLKKCGDAVYRSLRTADEKAIWVMQGWIFENNPDFWQKAQTAALLTSVPQGKMIVLDLQSESKPTYKRFNGYFGQPWVWCMLNNFGGVSGLYGYMNGVLTVFDARQKFGSSMLGIGLTPEGIGNNDIMYHLIMETMWFNETIDRAEWLVTYAEGRYGKDARDLQAAIGLLMVSAYDAWPPAVNHGQYAISKAPSLSLRSKVWFEPKLVWWAWGLYVNASKDTDLRNQGTFRNDLVDVGRESLQLYFDDIYNKTVNAFKEKNEEKLKSEGAKLLDLLLDLNTLLATSEHFLLGPWLESAKAWGNTIQEKVQYEFNARNQITLWGPNGEISDYATKQWAGIVSNYYLPRWKLFVDTLSYCLKNNISFNSSKFQDNLLKTVEIPFTKDLTLFPTTTKGDPIQVSLRLYNKYKNLLGVAKLTNV